MFKHFYISGVKNIVCDKCNKRYKYPTSLYNHQKFECGKTKSFKCTHCQKAFWHKGALKTHLSFKRCKFGTGSEVIEGSQNPNEVVRTAHQMLKELFNSWGIWSFYCTVSDIPKTAAVYLLIYDIL